MVLTRVGVSIPYIPAESTLDDQTEPANFNLNWNNIKKAHLNAKTSGGEYGEGGSKSWG